MRSSKGTRVSGRGEANERKVEYSFENGKGERRGAVPRLVPTSCAAEDAQLNEKVELTTTPSVWGRGT